MRIAMDAPKKLLILSFYYPPDLCAGSFRIAALVDALKKSPQRLDIHIISTMPNRYHGFTQEAPAEEQQGNIRISRITLPSHKSGFIDQARAFFQYFMETKKLAKKEHYDTVFATSSRLWTAFLGARIAKQQRCRLVLDIRDIFTETMDSILKFPLKQIFLPFFNRIERYTLRQANAINFVSQGFQSYFEKKLPAQCEVSYISNGIDTCFQDLTPLNTDKKTILYAGNIGEGQGLEKIIPDLAKRTPDYEWLIIGSGGRLRALQTAAQSIHNIKILPPVAREELIQHYQTAAILFVHLNDYAAFKRVLPSKLFEYAATGKPILAGVAGYAAEFIQTEIDGSKVFPPCNIEAGAQALQFLLANQDCYARKPFKEKYARSRLMEKLAAMIFLGQP
jgi:glycosyltransferase involved in cell wall biosynthesis